MSWVEVIWQAEAELGEAVRLLFFFFSTDKLIIQSERH